jgi:hypothetical protein
MFTKAISDEVQRRLIFVEITSHVRYAYCNVLVI